MKNIALMLVFLFLFSAVILVYAATPPPPPPPPPPIGGSMGSNQSIAANSTLPSCSDNVKNQQESDIDCGGNCTKCDDLKSCMTSDDCKNGYCNPDFECSAPSCSDGLKNGNETSIDCGGNCKSCIQPTQNQTQNNVQNQQEQRSSTAQGSSQGTSGSQLQTTQNSGNNTATNPEKTKKPTKSPENPDKGSLALAASAIFIFLLVVGITTLIFFHFKNTNKGSQSFDKNAAELKNFIGRNLKQGHSAQSIRQALLKKGWKEQSINQAFNNLRRW